MCVTAFTQVPPPGPPISPEEIDSAKKTVENFCVAWEKMDFNAMYALLSAQGMGQMTKEEFTRTYEPASDKSGMLSSYVVNNAVPNEDGLTVKAELTFEKDKTPNLVNGEHSFHVVKDGGVWKIKTIVAPVPAPGSESGTGGSHPGE